MSDGSLLSIVDNSLAISHVLRQLNLPLSGRNTKLVRDYLNLHEVDLSHFTPNGLPPAKLYSKICPVCSVEFFHLLNKEQTTCSKGCSNTYFKSGKNNSNWRTGIGSYRKLAFSYYGTVCSKCSFNNEAALDVHHIDKNRNNNSIDNLVVLCANCHRIEHSQVLP